MAAVKQYAEAHASDNVRPGQLTATGYSRPEVLHFRGGGL